MKLSQLDKRHQQTLINSKDIIQKGRKSMRRSVTAGPQYGSSKITVFAWDKNTILKY